MIKDTPMLIIENLNKTSGKQVLLKDVNFSLPRGSICALIGENGAGKSTIIKSVIGLYKFNEGKITVDDMDVKNVMSHAKMGYIPEKENFPKTPANVFLQGLAKLYGLKNEVIEEKTKYLSNLFGINEKINLKLHKMSSGQRKKIMIMQALYHDASLYIFDEPTENLDPDTRHIFYKELTKLRDAGKTVLICTHNLAEISTYIDYLVIVAHGQIAFQGEFKNKKDLYEMYSKFKYSGSVDHFAGMATKKIKLNNDIKFKKYDNLLKRKMINKEEYEILIENIK
jgi:ABC-2 type transport system ATP-binding protein